MASPDTPGSAARIIMLYGRSMEISLSCGGLYLVSLMADEQRPIHRLAIQHRAFSRPLTFSALFKTTPTIGYDTGKARSYLVRALVLAYLETQFCRSSSGHTAPR